MKQEKYLLRPKMSTILRHPQGNKFSWVQKFVHKYDAQTTMRVGTNETGEDYNTLTCVRGV
jgi:hypothetical protein